MPEEEFNAGQREVVRSCAPCTKADHDAARELRKRLHSLPAAVVNDALHYLDACMHGLD